VKYIRHFPDFKVQYPSSNQINMENLNSSTDSLSEIDLQFCQSLINRDNSESGCGSDLETTEAEADAISGEAAGEVPGGAVAWAVVPCSACLPQIKEDPVAVHRHLVELEELLQRAVELRIPFFKQWHFRQCQVAHYRGRSV
jgi:hypothetical protein